ncbi:MAG: hypothetical protein IJR94_01870 [Synergistaceae bacterium]|nr:hypothetical protein [Synergistaceae bacterium]
MTLRDKPRLLGALEGKIYVADDCFDDQWELVSPEELDMLETLRASKKMKEKVLKEVAI